VLSSPSRLLCLVSVLFWVLMPGGVAAANCIKTVRWEATQPPYNLLLPDGRRGGYYADLISEALRRMGCEARLVDMRWPRALAELEAGRLDILSGVLSTPERLAYARFTRGVNLSPNRLYLTAEARSRYPALRELTSLRDTGLTIGVESQAVYGPAYSALMVDPRFRARLYFVPTQRTGWQMLASGRLDGVISDDVRARLVGLPMQPQGTDVRAVLTVAAAPALIGLSRKSIDAEFFERFDAMLGEMIEDGTLATFRERYIPCKTDLATLGCQRDADGLSPTP